jgi:nucleoid DNA-binding protein
MTTKTQQALIIIFAAVLGINSAIFAVDTTEIQAVQQKALANNNPLSSADVKVIDDFLFRAFEELFVAEDFLGIVQASEQIRIQKGTQELSHYSASYISSVRKRFKIVFEELGNWETDKRKIQLQRSLAILLSQLQSPELAEFGIGFLSHKDVTVRYWAVKSVTNDAVVRQLNSEITGDADLTAKIIIALDELLAKETHAEILDLICRFAHAAKADPAKPLLIKIAEIRIAAYENWTVRYELMDAALLQALGSRLLPDNFQKLSVEQKALFARTFGQLYSYVFERYILGVDILNDVSKRQLASVLIKVEKTVKLIGIGRFQTTIREAVQKRNLTSLESQRKSLLGSETRAGRLGMNLNFEYIKTPGQGAATAPKPLPKPPKPPEVDAEG